MDDNIEPMPSPSTARHLLRMELRDRDLKAIAYSKSLLLEGDTMVFISYPSNMSKADPMGFPRAKYRMVNSENLLKTGSKVFARLLSEPEQARIRRRKGYTEDGDLPKGVKYVLDLTPPDEGDEAVELISELSCSLGLRQWYSAALRCHVSNRLVGGEDDAYRPTTPNLDQTEIQSKDENSDPPIQVVSDVATAPAPAPDPRPQPLFEFSSASTLRQQNDERRLNQVIEKSKAEFFETTLADRAYSNQASTRQLPRDVREKDIPEYCPVRHRTGIERLLYCIEGNDPGLDSAPKVWTLFVLAKYFDCTRVVLDYIVTWLIVEPNCQIMEILPEACLKMGVGLRSPMVTRATFAVLVSEQALSVASRMLGKHTADILKTNQFFRPQEPIDEDWLNSIQHAGQDFHDRITKLVENLVDERMLWFQELPEYRKICHFEDHNNLTKTRSGIVYRQRLLAIQSLVTKLRHYVRGRLARCIIADLPAYAIKLANDHRGAETHGPRKVNFANIWETLAGEERVMTRFFWTSLHDLVWTSQLSLREDNQLSQDELCRLPFGIQSGYVATTMSEVHEASISLNRSISEAVAENNAASTETSGYSSSAHGDDDDGLSQEPVTHTYASLYDRDHAYHQARLAGMKKASTVRLSEINPDNQGTSPIDIPIRPKHEEMLSSPYPALNYDTAKKTWFEMRAAIATPSTFLRTTENALPTAVGGGEDSSEDSDTAFDNGLVYPHLADGGSSSATPAAASATADITPWSPHFNIERFIRQVSAHLRATSDLVLARTSPELDFSTLTDTLLCLNENEFKYLPLWAGGNEDGTGGVFDDFLPAADAGPNGPGPSYHTGLSLGSTSREGSVAESSGRDGESVNTSLGVEDGFTDSLDRRRVYSFSSASSSSNFISTPEDGSDSDGYTLIDKSGKAGAKAKKAWKGKGVDRSGAHVLELTTATHISDSDSLYDAFGDIGFSDTIGSDDGTEVGDRMDVGEKENDNSHNIISQDSAVDTNNGNKEGHDNGKSSDFEDDEEFWNDSDESNLFADDDDEDEDTQMIDELDEMPHDTHQ